MKPKQITMTVKFEPGDFRRVATNRLSAPLRKILMYENVLGYDSSILKNFTKEFNKIENCGFKRFSVKGIVPTTVMAMNYGALFDMKPAVKGYARQ